MAATLWYGVYTTYGAPAGIARLPCAIFGGIAALYSFAIYNAAIDTLYFSQDVKDHGTIALKRINSEIEILEQIRQNRIVRSKIKNLNGKKANIEEELKRQEAKADGNFN